MKYIAKTALIVCSAILAYHTQEWRLLLFWFLAMLDWD